MNSSSPKTVWLCLDSLTFGGIETHVFQLAKGLYAHNVRCKVWLLRRYDKESPLIGKLTQYNIEFGYLDSTSQHWWRQLLHMVKTDRPDVIHAHGYKASLACKLIRLVQPVRQISTYHAGETPKGRVWLYDLLDRMTSALSHQSIAVSEKIATKLYSHSLVMNNFIDTDNIKAEVSLLRSNDRALRPKQVAFVGRLSEEKAPDRFVALAKQHPTLSFDLYGAGPMASDLSASAPNNVTLHGHQSDMDAIWPQIQILIICSRYEGLPMTAIEAMARGITVISLDVGDMNRLINSQNKGYIVKDMTQVGEQLSGYFALSSESRTQIAKNAITQVNHHFSQRAVIPKLLSIYFHVHNQSDSHYENSMTKH